MNEESKRNVSVIQDTNGNNIVAMIIRHDEDNKKYLYDIMNIKKEMSSLFQS